MRTIKAVSAAVLLTTFASEAQSQSVWQVTNRTDIAGSVIDWDGIFGPMPISDQSVFAGWRTLAETGMSISVSSPGGLDLLRQGSEWMGNFNHDDPVLRTAAYTNPVKNGPIWGELGRLWVHFITEVLPTY